MGAGEGLDVCDLGQEITRDLSKLKAIVKTWQQQGGDLKPWIYHGF